MDLGRAGRVPGRLRPRARRAPRPVRRVAGAGVRLGAGLPRVRLRCAVPADLGLRAGGIRASPCEGRVMDPALFLADLEEKPARLRDLAASLRTEDPWAAV